MLKLKIFLSFFLFFAIFSCKNVSESSLNLNVDPLTEAYKYNNVEYYLRIVFWKDTIATFDSVCVNKTGLITFEKTKKSGYNENRIEYDSLNRIIKVEHHSDIHYKSKIEYEHDKKSNDLISHIFSYNENTNSYSTNANGIKYHKFRNGKLSEQIYIDIESKDTLEKNIYSYNSNNKLYKISKNHLIDNFENKIEYKYRKNNSLKEIIDNGEVKYISEKSGLIDSVKQTNLNETIIYKYYFRKK